MCTDMEITPQYVRGCSHLCVYIYFKGFTYVSLYTVYTLKIDGMIHKTDCVNTDCLWERGLGSEIWDRMNHLWKPVR